jgi:ADP-dependent glucokinase
MVAQSPNTRVHFEMASFSEAELLYQLTQHITPYADSLGMNEQVKETLNLAAVFLIAVCLC